MKKLDSERQALLERGLETVQAFIKLNKVRPPKIVIRPIRSSCGLYERRAHRINVDPAGCARIGRGGMAWSYPGYKIDRTPFGVLAHELGHAVGEDPQWRRLTGEAPLTGYCPNDYEWFAEMFRLFVTNPMLLKKLRPATYKLMRTRFEPLHRKHWRVVLRGATRQLAYLDSKF